MQTNKVEIFAFFCCSAEQSNLLLHRANVLHPDPSQSREMTLPADSKAPTSG